MCDVAVYVAKGGLSPEELLLLDVDVGGVGVVNMLDEVLMLLTLSARLLDRGWRRTGWVPLRLDLLAVAPWSAKGSSEWEETMEIGDDADGGTECAADCGVAVDGERAAEVDEDSGGHLN